MLRALGGSALALCAAVAAFSITERSVAGQAAQANTYKAPRLADGRPNLNGIWQALNTANYDIQAHVARAGLAMRPGPYVFGVAAGLSLHAAFAAFGLTIVLLAVPYAFDAIKLAGAAYLLKPFQGRALLALVGRLLPTPG